MAADLPWANIRVLSFDVYGTLVDQNKGIINTVRATSVGPYLPTNDMELLQSISQHSSELEQGHPTMRKSDINAECFRRYISGLNLVENGDTSKEEVEKAAEEFGSKMGKYPAFSDTVTALKRLGQRYKLIALSNVDHSSFETTLLDQLEGNPFDKCYIAEDIGSYKPNLNNFRYLLDHMKNDFDLEQSHHCHIAQSLPVDHSATKQMGIRSVWVDRYDILRSSGKTREEMQTEYGYKLRVRSIAELADIVDRALTTTSVER